MVEARVTRTFDLVRDEDETGISGTGVVAQGVVFGDGTAVLRWIVGEHRSTVVWSSIESVETIHGHGGRTRIVYRDEVETVREEERAEFDQRLTDVQRETRRQLDAQERRIERLRSTSSLAYLLPDAPDEDLQQVIYLELYNGGAVFDRDTVVPAVEAAVLEHLRNRAGVSA